jgi:hypothetical protein
MRFKSIHTRDELSLYIRRKLGAESHSLELTDENIDDCINDTIEYFIEHAYDGSDEYYQELQLIDGQTLYRMDDNILAVLDILSPGYKSGNEVAWQSFYETAFQGLYTGSGGGMLDYALTQNYINSMEDIIQKDVLFTHNQTTNELRILSTERSKKVLLHVIRYPGESKADFDSLYGHKFVKDYSVALAFYTWGVNLIKYRGSVFSGGLEIDKEAILQEGKEQLEKAEEMFNETYKDSFGMIYK